MSSASVTELQTNTTPSTDDAIQQPRGIFSLPRELRDSIYDLALSRDYSSDAPVDITKASMPCTAILRVCRQFHNEAIEFVPAARRDYWSSTRFLVCTANLNIESEINRLNEEDVGVITKLEIRDHTPTFIFDNGIWTCTRCKGDYDYMCSCPKQAIMVPVVDLDKFRLSKALSPSQARSVTLTFFESEESLMDLKDRLVMLNCQSPDKINSAAVKATGFVRLSKRQLILMAKEFQSCALNCRP